MPSYTIQGLSRTHSMPVRLDVSASTESEASEFAMEHGVNVSHVSERVPTPPPSWPSIRLVVLSMFACTVLASSLIVGGVWGVLRYRDSAEEHASVDMLEALALNGEIDRFAKADLSADGHLREIEWNDALSPADKATMRTNALAVKAETAKLPAMRARFKVLMSGIPARFKRDLITNPLMWASPD